MGKKTYKNAEGLTKYRHLRKRQIEYQDIMN